MKELEIVHHRQMEGLTIFFDTVEYRTPHIHPEWEFLWLLENSLSVTCGQCKFVMNPGEMILFCPNEMHEFHKVDQGATFLCLQISSEILPTLPLLTSDGKTPQMYFDKSGMDELKRMTVRIAEAYFQKANNYKLYCMGEICLLLYRLLNVIPYRALSAEEISGRNKKNARLMRLIQFVDDNYMHKIRLSDFARMEGCSMSYLSRFIKETLNQSFQEYVSSVRFHCACKLIAAGDMKMLDVCEASGFSDYRYFSRTFQAQYGMTPEQYNQYKKKLQLETQWVKHSLHSVERFYSHEESLKLIERHFGNLK